MNILQKVTKEKRDLDELIARLEDHIDSEEFQKYDLLERDLMNRQAGFMRAYSLTLGQRIEDYRKKFA